MAGFWPGSGRLSYPGGEAAGAGLGAGIPCASARPLKTSATAVNAALKPAFFITTPLVKQSSLSKAEICTSAESSCTPAQHVYVGKRLILPRACPLWAAENFGNPFFQPAINTALAGLDCALCSPTRKPHAVCLERAVRYLIAPSQRISSGLKFSHNALFLIAACARSVCTSGNFRH